MSDTFSEDNFDINDSRSISFDNSYQNNINTDILPLHRPPNTIERLLKLYDNKYTQDFYEDGYLRSSTVSFIEIFIPNNDYLRDILYIIGNIKEMMIVSDVNDDIVNNNLFKDIKALDDLLKHKINTISEIINYHFDSSLKFFVPPENIISDDEDNINPTSNDENNNVNEPMILEDGSIESEEQYLSRKKGLELLNLYPIDIPTKSELSQIINIINDIYQRVSELHESYLSLKTNLNIFQEERNIFFEVIKYLNRKNERYRQESDRVIQSTRLQTFENVEPDVARNLEDQYETIDLDDFEIHDIELEPSQPIADNIEDNILTQFGGYLLYGSIPKTKIHTLELLCNRATRGNLIFYHSELASLQTDSSAELKECFVIYTHGDYLQKKLEKIVDSLDGKVMSRDNSQESLNNLNGNIQGIENVLKATENHLFVELVAIRDQIPKLTSLIQKEFNVLKKLASIDNSNTTQSVIIKGWIPADKKEIFESYLKYKFNSIHSHLPLTFMTISEVPVLEDYPILSKYLNDDIMSSSRKVPLVPPTHFNSYTNSFVSAFQGIVDAYGTSKYKELNPAIPTIVTFPFMFSIMFGDIGHGVILFLISLVLVLNSKKIYKYTIDNEILAMAYNGRFILLLMGIFSVYIGFLYNDIFGKSMTLFRSGWSWSAVVKGSITAEKIPNHTYVFGIDSAWHNTENGLLFTNSYKMKLSIIMGFIHMLYSLFLSYRNYIYYQSYVDIMGNFLPGLIFMFSIFGYLTICIVLKWSINWTDPSDPRDPPSLLNMLINMFLKPGHIEAPLYKGQTAVQLLLLLVALICIPWLLIYKPLYLYRENKKSVELGYKSSEHQIQDILRLKQEQRSQALASENGRMDQMVISSVLPDDFEEFQLGDLIIHQIIHTIEFCLNCISHTASYLRLWALSLAHQQLSVVLWDMTLKAGLSVPSSGYKPGGFKEVLGLMFLFGMWFVLTCAILVAMEGTSAMLHALRLHWVEAMSKHFIGEGISFEAFSLEQE
ncbi:related to V-type proton ATPase subunit a, Golgi isoform [Hanseniaspora guilliermondii]|uniref:Related to V-type proton ATPase subunit a, Golgi isoform n=1 Tax=Hanseniaspora guilliermondii TaxID=56406 RepID=A0A1L0CNJ3_9ASCO|nr:related to V-type proton ATPase subunit a, Golgi isoform [Hanseniaspora guilliermondii]